MQNQTAEQHTNGRNAPVKPFCGHANALTVALGECI
jgi:hypothetical protein